MDLVVFYYFSALFLRPGALFICVWLFFKSSIIALVYSKVIRGALDAFVNIPCLKERSAQYESERRT